MNEVPFDRLNLTFYMSLLSSQTRPEDYLGYPSSKTKSIKSLENNQDILQYHTVIHCISPSKKTERQPMMSMSTSLTLHRAQIVNPSLLSRCREWQQASPTSKSCDNYPLCISIVGRRPDTRHIECEVLFYHALSVSSAPDITHQSETLLAGWTPNPRIPQSHME